MLWSQRLKRSHNSRVSNQVLSIRFELCVRTSDSRVSAARAWSFLPAPPRAAARFASFSCTSFSTSSSSSES